MAAGGPLQALRMQQIFTAFLAAYMRPITCWARAVLQLLSFLAAALTSRAADRQPTCRLPAERQLQQLRKQRADQPLLAASQAAELIPAASTQPSSCGRVLGRRLRSQSRSRAPLTLRLRQPRSQENCNQKTRTRAASHPWRQGSSGKGHVLELGTEGKPCSSPIGCLTSSTYFEVRTVLTLARLWIVSWRYRLHCLGSVAAGSLRSWADCGNLRACMSCLQLSELSIIL